MDQASMEFNEYQQNRYEKMQALRDAGIDPYPRRVERTHTSTEAIEAFEATEADEDAHPVEATLAGRLVGHRVMGKITFSHIEDGNGRVQLFFQINELGEESYERMKETLDLGDFIQATGTMFRTRTEEVTLRVQSWRPLAKALTPPPEKWHGLTDVEQRYRHRYVDLFSNEEIRDLFVTRSEIISAVRRFMDGREFVEVETPILQPLYGGAEAEPFITHHNWAKRDLYLRIALELYLKRLIVGGIERVYEIGKNFRNEGISAKHNPEFTMLEAYQAYADYYDMMDLVEACWNEVAQEVLGTTTLTFEGNEIDLSPPWPRVAMRDAILEHAGIDIEEARTYDDMQAAIREQGLDVDPKPTWGKLVDEVFSEYAEPNLIQPTIIIDYPREVSPLAKQKPDTPHLVERFEVFAGGLECGNAFTELNDPLEQLERFNEQQKAEEAGDQEAHPIDEDFVNALMYGMPPTGGIGWGIDRMVMLFTDQQSIREVILFPQLRERQE